MLEVEAKDGVISIKKGIYVLNPIRKILGVENLNNLPDTPDRLALGEILILFPVDIHRATQERIYVKALYCYCSNPDRVEATFYDYENFLSSPINEEEESLLSEKLLKYDIFLNDILENLEKNSNNFDMLFENSQKW